MDHDYGGDDDVDVADFHLRGTEFSVAKLSDACHRSTGFMKGEFASSIHLHYKCAPTIQRVVIYMFSVHHRRL